MVEPLLRIRRRRPLKGAALGDAALTEGLLPFTLREKQQKTATIFLNKGCLNQLPITAGSEQIRRVSADARDNP